MKTPVDHNGIFIQFKQLPRKVCCCLLATSCPILCNPMSRSPPGSSVRGIFQARILEWAVISFSRDRAHVSCIGRQVPSYH